MHLASEIWRGRAGGDGTTQFIGDSQVTMPKNLSLFGSYLQNLSRKLQQGWKKRQITRVVPPKAYGALPSASSQMSLWGDDDFNYRTKTIWDGRWKRHRKKPMTYKKDIHSDALNTTIYNLKVTPSALYNMDDAGGFDNYILRTPPQELRSATGEKMREVMYFYMKNPEAKSQENGKVPQLQQRIYWNEVSNGEEAHGEEHM